MWQRFRVFLQKRVLNPFRSAYAFVLKSIVMAWQRLRVFLQQQVVDRFSYSAPSC